MTPFGLLAMCPEIGVSCSYTKSNVHQTRNKFASTFAVVFVDWIASMLSEKRKLHFYPENLSAIRQVRSY